LAPVPSWMCQVRTRNLMRSPTAHHFQRKPTFLSRGNTLGILMLIIFTVLLSGYWLHGQIPNSAPNMNLLHSSGYHMRW
jgi:hypothetical protein